MGYKPIYDYTCDVIPFASVEDCHELLLSLYTRKLVLQNFKPISDGNEITIRGTKDQLVTWFREYYVPDDTLAPLEDKDVMFWAEDNGKLVCIA